MQHVRVLKFCNCRSAYPVFIVLLLALWGMACNNSIALAQASRPFLTKAEAVRMLTDNSAKLGYSVRLQGIVTYYDPDWPILYIQDSSGGIYVELEKQDPSLSPGQWIEVEGITAPGSFLPVVSKARVKLLGSKVPLPIRKASLAQLDIRRDDGQWMQLEGIVHNTYQEGKYTVLETYEGKHKVQIRIRELSQTAAGNLIDAVIQVRGVLAVIADSAHKPIGLDLWVSKENQISVVKPPLAVSSQLPVTAIAEIEKTWTSDPPKHRFRIQGTVMPSQKESTLLVQDKTGIIEAQTLFTRPIAPGDEVDLIGFADLGSNGPRIINAIYLRIKALAIESKEEKGLPTLTKISQIRRLDSKEAGRGYPVRIKGVITYHNPQLSMTFIQDDSDAIYLQSLDPALILEEGKKYEVAGFSAPGDFAPIITKPAFRLIGPGALPPARIVTLDQLSTGQYDCLRVQVGGIVRSVRQVGNRWCLEVFSEGKGIQVWIPNLMDSTHIHSLQDAKITAEGICSIQISTWGAIAGFKLNVPSISGIRVEEKARSDPFSAPLRSIRDVFRYSNQTDAGHRIRIQGVLLHQRPGRAIYIRDATGSISIPTTHILPVNSLDMLTISGYPIPGEFAPSMDHVLIKSLSSSSELSPRLLPDARALYNNFHGDLVRIRARLVEQWHNTDGLNYLLQDLTDKQTAFEATLDSSSYGSTPPSLRNGSVLELTGIYLLRTKTAQKFGFQLLLRTSEDIRVLKNAPWWTLKHTYWAFGILTFFILLASASAAMLKRRVNRQTRIIRNQVEAEAALEKKYRELFERSNDIVFACDHSGRLKSVNPAGARILGYTVQELMDLDAKQLLDPASLPKIEDWIKQRQKALDCPNLECELLAKDGRHVLVEVSGDMLYSNGQLTGAQGIARDITERKHAEEALRQSEEKLRQGQKLEAIGKLAGGIAHDFNNILAAILGYAELSATEIPPEHPVKSHLEQIAKAGKRARDVVQQILAFSRKLEQERRPIYLQTILDEALNLLRATLPATVEIETKIDATCGPVMADSTQMHQVILNLATNASHAMSAKGGQLRIILEPILPNGKHPSTFPELSQGKYVCLSVCDTGPGIAPEIQKQIFEPYFTTKSVGEGSGLGLAVVHGIVQSHGGAITVNSALGQGACFKIYLPCCAEKSDKPPVPAPEMAKGQGRILLIDDEEALVNLGRRALEKLGYQVTGETSSVRALKKFTDKPQQFDVVVTDQTMPQLTGLSLAQEIWKIRPELPVIISTGYSEQITSEIATSLGFHTFLNKPYTVSELARVIQQCLIHSKEPEAEINNSAFRIQNSEDLPPG
jgi:PAS domain S-box-containing protein